MTNLKTIKNENLLLELKDLVREEKKLIRQVLEHLEEVETRRLFLEKGFSSMFAFCTEYLDYSPQEAQIRIQAMRLSKSVPEVKKQIEEGELSLSVAARVQSHVGREQKLRKLSNQSPLKVEEKRKIVETVRNQSVRKSEEILFSIFPHHSEQKLEKVQSIGRDTVRVEMNLSRGTYELLMKVKALKAHTVEDFDAVVKDLCQTALKKYSPELRKPKSHVACVVEGGSTEHNKIDKQSQKVPVPQKQNNDRYITSAQRHYVWIRDKGRCSYTDQKSGQECRSNFRLQYDHVKPLAFGGKTTVENLRLLCFSHHQFLTQKSFPRRILLEKENFMQL